MGLIAVLVNCALIGLSGPVHRMFPEMSTTQTILLIVALEVSIIFVNSFSERDVLSIRHMLFFQWLKLESISKPTKINIGILQSKLDHTVSKTQYFHLRMKQCLRNM